MIRKIECVCVPTRNVADSTAFYVSLGLQEGWKIERPLANGQVWTLVGLKFPDAASSELVLSDNPDVDFTEIELAVDDVRESLPKCAAIPALPGFVSPLPRNRAMSR